MAYPNLDKKGFCKIFNRMVFESTSACRDFAPITDRTYAAGRIMLLALHEIYDHH